MVFVSPASILPTRSEAVGLPARDAVAAIRASLARKLAADAAELAGLHAGAPDWEGLRHMARDACCIVRHTIADTLADLPDAPHDLVWQLSRDGAPEVGEPLIRLSSVLTEQDLLELVRSPPDPETRCAVARRLNLAAPVAAALLQSGDRAAMRALQRNPTANVPVDRTVGVIEAS